MRPEGWEKRLSEYLDSRKDMAFEWGKNDCILFAAKGYQAMTGIDYYSKYLPYTTEEEAREILRVNGGFEGILGKDIGPGHRNPLKARRGNPVLLKLKEITCGIVDDSGQWVCAPGKEKIVKYPISKAWRIWDK